VIDLPPPEQTRSAIGFAPAAGALDVATLPRFSNASKCPTCGRARPIRVHYDPGCTRVDGPHFHRLCPCGGEWLEA
jgi:hypothetical protein